MTLRRLALNTPLLTFALVLALAPACTDGETGSDSESATTSPTTSATSEATDATSSTGSGSTTSASSGESETAVDTTTTGDGVSFTEIYEQIIMPQGCNSGYCHGGGAGGLTMTDEATSYANLVEVDAMSMACSAAVRVVPGAPEESVLWLRARPAALDEGMPCASKMPEGSEGLSDADGQLLYDWIAGGALD